MVLKKSRINVSITKSQYKWLKRNKWINFSGFVRHIIRKEMQTAKPFNKHCKFRNKEEGYNAIVVTVTDGMKNWLDEYRQEHNRKEFLSYYIQCELQCLILRNIP